jgi:nickel-dependent lactate racemase
MAYKEFLIPYGKGEMAFYLPLGMRGKVVEPEFVSPLADVEEAIVKALKSPVNSLPLGEMAGPGDRVCIVFTDITRPCPDHLLMPPILSELEEAGVRSEDITILCGVGMHRPSTYEEKVAKLGMAVVKRYRVLDHDPLNPNELVELGSTPSGLPLSINRFAYGADFLISVGVVEPHQYAGYSGGPKTVAIGVAGERTIEHTHSPPILDHPGTRLGVIEGNPFQEAIAEAASLAGLDFILNVVLNIEGEVIAVRAGEPKAAFKELVDFARSIYEVKVMGMYDVVVAGVDHPKDINLYQASRAASYIFFAPKRVIKPGGLIVVPARCEEGVGEGLSEIRFYRMLKEAPNVEALLAEAHQRGLKPGEQRAFIMAKVLKQCDVIIVGAKSPALVREAKMIYAGDMEEAFCIASQKLGAGLEVLIVPHALLTLLSARV